MAIQRHSVLPGYYQTLPKQKKVTQSKPKYTPKYYNNTPAYTGYNGYYLPTAQDGGLYDWIKTGVQLLDPTGISSWGDAYDAISDFVKHPSWSGLGKVGKNVLSAIPGAGVLGKVNKVINKVEKVAKAADKIHDATIVASRLAKGKKVVQAATKPITKYVIKPTLKTVEAVTTGVPIISKIDKFGRPISRKILSTTGRVVRKVPGAGKVITKAENVLLKHPNIAKAMDYTNRASRWLKATDPAYSYILDPGTKSQKAAEPKNKGKVYDAGQRDAGSPEAERLADSTLQANPDLLITPNDFETTDPLLQQVGDSQEYRDDEFMVQRYGGSTLRRGRTSGGFYRMQNGGQGEVDETYYPEDLDSESYQPPMPGVLYDKTPNMQYDTVPSMATAAPSYDFLANALNPTSSYAPGVMGQVPVAAPTPSTFDLQPYEGVSIVDFLAKQGLPYDYSSRIQLAKTLGVPNYRGTASQNLHILSALQSNPQYLNAYAQMAPALSSGRKIGGGRRTGTTGAQQQATAQAAAAQPASPAQAQKASPTKTQTSKNPNALYYVTDANGKKSGPYTEGEIRGMILTDKINNNSQIEASPETWKKFKPGFQNYFGVRHLKDMHSIQNPLYNIAFSQNFKDVLDELRGTPYAETEEIPTEKSPTRRNPRALIGNNSQRRLNNIPKEMYIDETKGLPAGTGQRTLPSSGLTGISDVSSKTQEANRTVRGIIARGYWTRQDMSKLNRLGMKQSSIDRILQRFPKEPNIPAAASSASEASETMSNIRKAARIFNTLRRFARFEEGGDYSGTWSGNSYYDMGGDFPYGGVVSPYDLMSYDNQLPQYEMGSDYEDDLGEDEMYVTPEEMESLRQQGYDFDVIG